jgi:hypothetical protein
LLHHSLCAVGLASRVNRVLELAETDEGGSEASKVGDVAEKELGGLEHVGVKAALANILNLSNVGSGNELLQIGQAVRLGESIQELRLNHRLARLATSHLKEADEVLKLILRLADADDLEILGRVIRLDV